ncbi:MAG: sigma factor [Gemmatimonadaceae bacterium]
MNIRKLFERHYPSLVWSLHGRLGDRDLAEDLAQEAFVRLVDKLPRTPDSWLYVVAGNLARDAQAHPATALLRDACCSDHDGGDRDDDGLLTLSSVGEKVTVVIVYEDVDHSGTFTHGDIVRYVSTVPHSAPTALPAH